MQPTSDETQSLRRCVRDLVALSTLPAVWENADPLGIGRGLAEVLLRILAADFLYVRLRRRDGEPPLEALRTRQRAETEARAHEVGKSLESWLRFEDADAPPMIPNPLGDGTLRLAVFPIGHGHDHGLLAAGCGRANFPGDTERLLLGVAGNQAAGLLQRKEAEEQLRRSEQELADFFENAAVGLHWAGPDGRILRVNQAELDLLGYNREEYLGRHIAEFHADRDVIEDILRRLSAGETLRDCEARMRCKDGTLKHVLINSNVLWEGGRFVHTRCFTRDITDRRLAEESLRKQSEWLRVTLASIGDAVITTDTAGHVTSLNAVAESLTGWPQVEAQGQPLEAVFRIINEQSREAVENPATRVLREGQIVGLANHTVLRARDGTERAIDDSAAPIKDEQGNLLGVILIFRDVSEKRQAERAVAESEARKSAILQTALDCIITCDEQGRVLEFNPAAQRTFGYEPAEVLGRDMANLIIPPAMRDRHRGGMTRYLATGEAKLLNRRIEMTARRADGTDFPAELAITRIPTPGPPQFTAYLRDITERKSLERRRSARLAVTQAMAQAATLKDAAPRILQAVCDGLGWDMGAFWAVDRQANVLRCQELWHTPSVRAEAFVECCRQGTFNPGIGLPGRVWQSGRPAWIPNVAQDTNFPRVATAVKEGLHGAFGAPVLSGSELLGVIEFFSREIRDPDPDLLEMMATIGSQIGQFMDRKASEETLRRLAAIVESSDDAIISKNLDGIITSWNRGAERLYGYTAGEVVGRPVSLLMPPDHQDDFPTLMERLERGERIEHYETVRVAKDGRRIDVSLTISPLRDAQGKIVGASKIARDITERKRAEAALRQSEERLTAELEATTRLHALSGRLLGADNITTALEDVLNNAIVTVGADLGNIQLYNAKIEALEIVAQRGFRPDFLDYFRTVRADEGSACAQAMQSGVRIVIEDVNLDPSYEPHRHVAAAAGYRAVQSTPLKTHDGSILGVLSTHFRGPHRVSDRDQQLLDLYARHAADLIERLRFEQALKDADRRKDEFLATLAHELRNPLAPIRNAVQIIRAKGAPVPELQWARDVIERQVQQMTRLVDDLLDVSRITTGKIELRKERVELATVVNSAVEASRPLIEKWGHELTVELPSEPVYLDADQTRLAQVLLNLLNNAAKYTEQGGRIWLTAEREGESVVIRVKDTGIGIPQEILPRIFEMFTQVDRSLERSQGGLGIGLTLVQSLVEMHGGTVEAHSDGPGKGSEFVVQLPVAAEIKDRGRDGAAGSERVAAPAKCRILVVDDNQDAADSLAMLLRILGNEVHTAHDGLEAVGAAGVFRPDVVLLDIGLPKLNGYEAGRRIREQQGNGVVLIALTGWGQEEDRRRSKEAGFDHHMTKPVEFDALQTLLAELKTAAS
ncbi:MAG TPA: PAS domain S-box protein [Gemmataceae bacterium]|nr:PAS domain S-box protein [Gemmataceae bacterium]